MSTIVFFCIPAHGHTNPTLNIVRELVRRGHKVYYYSYDCLQEKIEASGAIYVSCDSCKLKRTISSKDTARFGKDLIFSTQVLVDTALALDDTICTGMAHIKPDCIVADSMAIWGKAAAIKLGIPFVSSTTTFAFNRYSAKIMKQNALSLFKMLAAMPKCNKLIKPLQDKGYPIKNILDILQNNNDTPTIVYTSPEFQPCADTFSHAYTFIGPSIRPAETEIEKRKDTLIYISAGTVINNKFAFYKKCISALKNSNYQVIISTGNSVSEEMFGVLPEHISVFKFVDQIAVLQKADVFISHCGMNSVNESLYFGVPLIMIPQTAEQNGVAERVFQLGAGIKLRRSNTASKNSITAAIKTVLCNPAYKKNANALSESFKQCQGASGAADKILQLCAEKKL